MDKTTLFVDVILPLSVEGKFTYRVPFELNEEVAVGKRVVVQFGKKRIYTALIYRVHDKIPEYANIKYILGVLDEKPVVNEIQFRFWEWMAFYYYTTIGEVMNAAMPAAFKLASETQVVLNPEFDGNMQELSDKEYLVTEALTLRSILTLSEISKITGQFRTFNLVKTLIEKGVILVEEELKEKYQPKKESYVVLNEIYRDESCLKDLLDKLERKAEKQIKLLLRYIQLAQKTGDMFRPVSRKSLLSEADASSGVLESMIKKEIFETAQHVVSRLEFYDKPLIDTLTLTDFQQEALDNIRKCAKDNKAVLLHGVASCGKTEIYAKLIQEYIEAGMQVLFLMPEIALTTQMIMRLRKFFGNAIGVYHSKFSDAERLEIWNAVQNKNTDAGERRYQIILGARSALFLPYTNLGLIIVDEEHESSYKQQHPAPFYNARDCAVYLAQLHQCPVLLGSATPAVETYYNCTAGKYALVELPVRYNNLPLPEFQVVDMADLFKKKALKSVFAPVLLEQIEACLNNREQVILFQNRRGFALWLECQSCHHIHECPHCDVTLTYHKKENALKCHYCGYKTFIPDKCPACSSTRIQMKSYGTERLEDELGIFFPKAKIARMDYDTTRSKHAFQELINDFEARKVDIMVGTQMLSKGMDFDNVGLVGVLNVDNMLHFPDFRSFERAFQLVAQVSGRTGRKTKRGKVVLQCYEPKHFVVACIVSNDYQEFYKQQIAERKKFFYPPFSRLIHLSLKHRQRDTLDRAAALLAQNLRARLPKRILGPEFPYINKIRNEYIKDILVKVEKGFSSQTIRGIIKEETEKVKSVTEFCALKVVADVDPM